MWRAFMLLAVTAWPALAVAQELPQQNFLNFIKAQARALRATEPPPPNTLDEWTTHRAKLRAELLETWGGWPKVDPPLEPQLYGTLKRDGYTVEKLTIQTLPGVRMTANAYVPASPGKHPAVLCVHGHWPGAKQDPTVQARCIGLVKLGFFVLCVDALGAGERAIGTALGEYHGEMVGASLLSVGAPLSGLQVYENRRAVDYLLTRPEVDGQRLGITGASGGGNQTMYAGAMDERLKCVVPVCSVGTYQAYLGAACCMCEVVPGALQFTEESGLLRLVAPRALMVISATRDAFQFSVGEAKKSLAAAQPIFDLLNASKNLRHTVFESGHDYSQPMREAMYGWMTLHLKGVGDGSPIPEPKHQTENPEDLRCFPGNSRPADFVTIPKLLGKFAAQSPAPTSDTPDASVMRSTLTRKLLGDVLPGGERTLQLVEGGSGRHRFEPEPGVWAYLSLPEKLTADPVLLVTFDREATLKSELYTELQKSGKAVVLLEPRASGPTAWPSDKIGRAPDHNTAEWSLWIGRPLLGQWVADCRRALDALEKQVGRVSHVMVCGEGPAAMVALLAGSVEPRVGKVVTRRLLASYVSPEPIVNQRLGLFVPGLVRDVGDVPRIVGLSRPKPQVIIEPVWGSGQALTSEQAREQFPWLRVVADNLKAGNDLRIITPPDKPDWASLLK